MNIKNKYIGCNYTGMAFIGGIISSFDGTFKNEEVLIGSGLDYIPCVMGNVNDAYEMLKEKIKEKNAHSLEEICACIYDTVDTYFGGIKNISKRMSYYKDFDFIETEADITRVSTLKGTGAAMCVERSMLSQNLLKLLGYNTFYKTSCIEKNGKLEIHAYNLLASDGKYYIFDSSIPTKIDNVISPLITEIPEEAFQKMIVGSQKDGYSIHITHYNGLRDNMVDITYDARRQQLYDADLKNKTK